VGTRCADHAALLHPPKLALTSATRGGHSVSIVPLRNLFYFLFVLIIMCNAHPALSPLVLRDALPPCRVRFCGHRCTQRVASQMLLLGSPCPPICLCLSFCLRETTEGINMILQSFTNICRDSPILIKYRVRVRNNLHEDLLAPLRTSQA
jgi:hypothetical protein